jgi:D-alanine-D-alanine ligase
MGKRFTGSSAVGISLAQDKALAKKLFQFHGIRFPRFSVFDGGTVEWPDELRFPLIVKPLNQDSSIGIDGKAIVTNSQELMARIEYIHHEFKCPVLVEEFIEGREIYVGVIGNEASEALPILEWDFSALSDDTPKIATSEAKWDKESEAYHAPQCFPDDLPKQVYAEIQRSAVEAFKALKLRDYARVDLRLRYIPKGTVMLSNPRASKKAPAQPDSSDPLSLVTKVQEVDAWEFYVIEVNPNPHLEKRAEFALAARKKGLSYPEMLERILEAALKRSRPPV